MSYYMFYTLHVVEPLRYDSVLIKLKKWMNEWTNEWMMNEWINDQNFRCPGYACVTYPRVRSAAAGRWTCKLLIASPSP